MNGKNSADVLVNLLTKGDEKAYETIFHEYYRPLTLFALKYVNDIDDAKEITQEFFIRLWSKRRDLKITSLKTYLFRGVRNACLNYLEANKVTNRRMKDYENPTFTSYDALNKMMLAEQEEELMQVIDNLPPRCKAIFLMSRNQQLSHKAIAQQLNISVKTVESQMSIALKRLRDLLLAILLLYRLF